MKARDCWSKEGIAQSSGAQPLSQWARWAVPHPSLGRIMFMVLMWHWGMVGTIQPCGGGCGAAQLQCSPWRKRQCSLVLWGSKGHGPTSAWLCGAKGSVTWFHEEKEGVAWPSSGQRDVAWPQPGPMVKGVWSDSNLDVEKVSWPGFDWQCGAQGLGIRHGKGHHINGHQISYFMGSPTGQIHRLEVEHAWPK